MSELSIADVLERAADLIEPEGAWGQGFGDRRKGHCAFTAIGAVADNSCDEKPAINALANFVAPGSIAKAANVVWRWNDAPGRTQAEVVAKLREAAKLARGETS